MNILELLEMLYAKEINWSLSCFWDGGYKAKLGDEMNGFTDEMTFAYLDCAIRWLWQRAHQLYLNEKLEAQLENDRQE